MAAPPDPAGPPPPGADAARRWRVVVARAVAAGALWVASLVSLVVAVAGASRDPLAAGGWIVQAMLTVVAAPLVVRWWRRVGTDRPRRQARPPELDEAPGRHLGLGGDVTPPSRW